MAARSLATDLTRMSNRNDRAPDVNNRRNSLELRRRDKVAARTYAQMVNIILEALNFRAMRSYAGESAHIITGAATIDRSNDPSTK